MSVNNVSGSFNALQNLYYQKHGKNATADELVTFAKMQRTNIFNVWDTLADGDDVLGNTVSSDRYYANENTLLFQSSNGQIADFNMNKGTVSAATNGSLGRKLDILDDNMVNLSMDADKVRKSEIILGRDVMNVYQPNELKTPTLETEDYKTNIITISSEDTSKLLTKSANSAGFKNVNDFINATKNNKELENQFNQSISNYLIGVFGGSKEKVIRNLADVQQLPHTNAMIDNLYGQIIGKVASSVMNTYKDHSKSNNDVNFFNADIFPTAVHFGDLKKAVADAIRIENQNTGKQDPIGFEANNKKYDFIEDQNNDGKFTNSSEFVGADYDWTDLLKYDLNNDGKINGNELAKLNVLVTDKATGKSSVTSALKAGINEIDVDSYQSVNQNKKEGNFLAGIFNVIFNGQNVTGEQTYESEDFLKKNYSQAFGLNLAV